MAAFSAQDMAGLVWFGDSLTDNGNLFAAAAGVIPEDLRLSLAGPTGAASDGVTHAAYAADLLGLPGMNYAVAGAEAVGSQTLDSFITGAGLADQIIVPPGDPALAFDMNLGAQVARFRADSAGQDLSGLTGVVLVGLNDYAAIDLTNPVQALREARVVQGQIIDATLAAAASLFQGGMGAVVVLTLPRAAFLPIIAGEGDGMLALAQGLFDDHNAALADAIGALAGSGAPIRLLDLGPITQALAEDPRGFGFIAPYLLTLTSGDPALAGFDADQVAFWDSEHPTTTTHGILGAYEAFALTAAPLALTDAADVQVLTKSAELGLALDGADQLTAKGGDDSLFGGLGNDSLNGGQGADLLSGGTGADDLRGKAGDDVLSGSEGADALLGADGADRLVDGLGSDLMSGGAGDDLFIFQQAELIGGTTGSDQDTVNGQDGADTLILVLDHATWAALGADLAAGDKAALAALGLTLHGIESVLVLDGRDALDTALAGQAWYDAADLWGLV